jgi:HAE1 family hydrophobic/amphiphilic exporter-1
MEMGENAYNASMRGAEEIGFTILSMTLSLGAVFLPLVFMSGLIGRVFREFSIVVVVSILASGFVSLTLTPMMCRFMLTGHTSGVKTGMEKFANRVVAFCLHWYGISLHWFLKRRLISLLAWFVTLGATIWLFILLPKSFLPVGDSGVIRGMFMAPTGTSPERMVEYQDKIDEILQAEPAVEESVSVANLTGGNIQANQALTFVFLRERNKRKPIAEIAHDLIAKISSIPGIFVALRPDPTLKISAGATSETQGQYCYVLTGLNAPQLYASSEKLIGEIRKIPGVLGVSSDMMLDMPNLTINILRDKASYYGVSAEAIEMVIRNAYAQNYVYLIKSTITQYQVIVEVEDRKRANAEDLNNLYVLSQTLGRPIPLRSVCTWEKKVGPSTVNHLKQFPAVSIFFNLAPNMPIGTAQKAIEKLAKSILPQEISREFYGEAELFAETVKSLTALLFVAVFVMYVIMGILYESYFHPVTVLSALPVACVGGLIGLLIFGQELSLYAFIGLFMLMGIVKKNGILMVDFAIHLQQHGKNSYDAVHEACLERFRPIIMTTMAALMGAVPIAVGYGADGESRMGLGITVVAGLIFSQIITLYVTPVIYLYLEDIQEWVYGEKRKHEKHEQELKPEVSDR